MTTVDWIFLVAIVVLGLIAAWMFWIGRKMPR